MTTTRQASTRARILTAAVEVIAEHGVSGATTKRIAASAGCSEALIYKHFTGKEELFLAVILEVMPGLAHALDRLRSDLDERPLADALTAFAESAVEFYRQAAPIASGLLTDPALLAAFRSMLAVRQAGPHIPIAVLAGILRAQQAAGRIRAGADCDGAAALLMGACYQRADHSLLVELPTEPAAFARSAVSALLTGLSA